VDKARVKEVLTTYHIGSFFDSPFNVAMKGGLNPQQWREVIATINQVLLNITTTTITTTTTTTTTTICYYDDD